MRYWTHYWANQTSEDQAHGVADHTAANGLISRNAAPGDRLYIVSFFDEKLHLIGRMKIDMIVDQASAESILKINLWSASDHAIARHGSSSSMTLSRVMTLPELEQVEFIARDGRISGIKYRASWRVEPQAFRGSGGVREISARTARLFDQKFTQLP